MGKRKRDYDQNITLALQKIQWPIINAEGISVSVRKTARNENGFEHIAGKMHLLKIRDIDLIPYIIKNPLKVVLENKGRKGKAYFGKRKGINKSKYLKIVVRCQGNKSEEIVTVYSTKGLK